MKPITSFGVVAFKCTDQVRAALAAIHRWSVSSGVAVYFHPSLAGMAPAEARVLSDVKDLLRRSEALVSVGGDGTFLSVARLCLEEPKPVVGVNLGGLGFLTTIGPDAIDESLGRLNRGDYRTIDRTFLRADLVRDGAAVGTYRALNDVYVTRYDNPKLASVSVWFGDEFVNDFQADGIVVATAAGSTAYSLSAGGPIVEPSARALLLTPICPHALAERPIVFPDDRPVRLVVNHRNPSMMLSADGIDSCRLKPGDEITVRCDRNRASLVQLSEVSFFQSLRTKLDWGVSNARRRQSEDAT